MLLILYGRDIYKMEIGSLKDIKGDSKNLVEILRNILMKVAEFSSKYIKADTNIIYTILLILFSVFIAKKLADAFAPEESESTWMIVIAIILYFFIRTW